MTEAEADVFLTISDQKPEKILSLEESLKLREEALKVASREVLLREIKNFEVANTALRKAVAQMGTEINRLMMYIDEGKYYDSYDDWVKWKEQVATEIKRMTDFPRQ